MSKPTIAETKLEFASSDIVDPGSGQNNKVETSTTKKTNGWSFLEKPPFNWMNYWMNLTYLYIKWIVQEALEGAFTFTGIKTFSSIPVLPSSDPTTDNQAVRKKYVDNRNIPYVIEQIGNDLVMGSLGTIRITALSSNRIAFLDGVNDDLRTYDFDGSTWSQVGNDLNISSLGGTFGITALSSNRIAFIDSTNEDLRTYDFDGTDWAQVGNDLNISGVSSARITALSSNRIALISVTLGYLRTYDFDGTDWAQVGNSLSGISDLSGNSNSTSLSSNRIALIGDTNLRTYDFDGTDWAQVGNSLSISTESGARGISALSSNRILMIYSVTGGSNANTRIYNFDGTNWTQISTTFYISGTGSIGFAVMNSAMFSFVDTVGEDLRTYHITWSPLVPYQTIL
jgi:hypothetical protein